MEKKRFTPRALILTAALTLVLTLGALALTAWLLLGPGGVAVLQSMGLIRANFPGEYDAQTVSGSAIQGMVDGLDDRWSGYFTREEGEGWNRQRENIYVGVGLTYVANETSTAMEIVGLTPGGPAERAGLLVGETITAIDGQALNGDNLEELVGAIQERTGTDVTLTVLSADGASRQVTVRTDKIGSDPITWVMLEGDVGYARIENFYDNSAAAFRDAVGELIDQGARALIFDVRYNPGGYVTEVTGMLDYLLPEGPIFVERSKNGPTHTIYSDADCVDLPMAVLINGDSYSAAELFAAQLRESAGATLVGERTVGKGFYQKLYRLVDGNYLNLSSGMYTTGGGQSLAGVGLTPDIQESDLTAQLERAEEYLREKLG